MSTCTIYYPGLLGPDVPIEELSSKEWPDTKQTRHLCQLFSLGKAQPRTRAGIDARILECMGVYYSQENDLPVSEIRANKHDLTSDSCWCLDPVHIQIDRDEAVLVANESLELDQQQAQEIINDLNQHFKQDGLKIHYHNPHQWLLTGAIELKKTDNLNDVLFKDIADHQPTGKDKLKWHTLINEAQMLLHSHPVNEQRELHGKLTVNSLWIWGGGRLGKVASNVNVVFANNSLVNDVAKLTNISHASLPEHLDHKYFINNDALIILTDQVNAIRQSDVFGWFEYLKQFEREVLAPLFALVKQGDIGKITIVSDTVSFSVTRKELHRYLKLLFNIFKTFESHVKRLRMQYGC